MIAAPMAPGAVAAPAAPVPAQPRGPCDMGLTFFPPQGDNLPTGWSQAVQQSAGNTQVDQMMKIALAGYPIPQLYMAPLSVYTQVRGAAVLVCVCRCAPVCVGLWSTPLLRARARERGAP